MDPEQSTTDWRVSRRWQASAQPAEGTPTESSANLPCEARGWPQPFYPAPSISDSPEERNEADTEMQDWARVARVALGRWMEKNPD